MFIDKGFYVRENGWCGYTYINCKCHLQLREYELDESVYHSCNHPSSRWKVNGRSHPINESRGVLRHISTFKDCRMREMCLKMTPEEI